MKFEINQPTIPEMATLEDDADYDIARPPLSPVVEMPPEYPAEESSTLLPCAICNRTFSPSALQRHSKVCEKLQSKKRNHGVSLRQKFDSTKQRQEGLDIPSLGLNSRDNKEEEKKKKSRWREKHQEFLRTIRAARGSPDEVGKNCDGKSQKIIPSDYVQCPYCERHFGPKAAERHINWCGEQKSRLPRSHTSEDTEATHRLKTRTKYTPPKPGQNEWRAPRKKDVISSIPPSNVGPNITPPGRLVSPPPPVHRQISPPPNVRPTPVHRHASPPPASPSRRTSSSPLPPGPNGSHRYSTASLGRAAGRHFASMLQSVTGCNPGYGVSSGYGSHSLYGSSSNQANATFNRSSSLRLPKRRSGTHGRMARHRDLASDMLASVTLGGKAKREEPEGDEASNTTPFYDRSPSKLDNAPYDPFSAAELQLQDLLGPSKPGGGLRSEMMGSTTSLKHIGASRRFSPERDPFPTRSKPRRSNLIGGGSLSLCSLGLDSFDFASCIRSSAGDDSSELESLENSPRDLRSPDDAINDVVSRFTTSRITDPFPSETSNQIYKQRSTSGHPESRYHHSRSPSLSSQSAKSVIEENHKRKHPEGGSNSCQKSPSPQGSFRFDSPERKSPVKERSPSPKSVMRLSSGLKKHENNDENSYVSSYRGWNNHSEVPGSPKTYSRYLSGRSQRDSEINSQAYSSAYESIKALRATMVDEKKISVDSSEEKNQRISSSSSTDSSSLAALSSPLSTTSPMRKEAKEEQNPSQTSSLPTFCYECGNKYPVVMAKFCCHCGARRLAIGQ